MRRRLTILLIATLPLAITPLPAQAAEDPTCSIPVIKPEWCAP